MKQEERTRYFGRLAIECRLMRIAVVAISMSIPVIAAAVPIGDIDVGDTYFINNVFSENELVVVKRIDRARGRVKIQYSTGGVDWVAPSKLYTRSGSRKADTEEVIVGTALVAGALWAIFDPDGFERAMANNNSRRSSSNPRKERKPAQTSTTPTSTVNISAVPFSPVISGSWSGQGEEWVNWAETTLKTELDKSVDIESVRTKKIPFYSTSDRNVVLAEAVQAGRAGAYYIVAETGKPTKVVLNGNGTPIHKMNKLMGLSIGSAAEAEAYLKFFTSAISADDGIFIVLEPNADYLPANLRRAIGINAIQVRQRDKKAWSILSDIIYGGSVFEAEFLVHRDGKVEMLNDSFKRDLSFEYKVVMDGPRRVYVSQR